MGFFALDAIKKVLTPDISGATRGIRRAAEADINRLGEAGTFAEQQLQPYMLDPSVMQEFQNVIAGDTSQMRMSPMYQNFYNTGREAMLEDMSGTGTLYSGTRMEGMRDLGQSAFGNYLNSLQSLAGFGRQTAGSMGSIRMGTAGNQANINQKQAADIANMKMASEAQGINALMGVGMMGANALSGGTAGLFMGGAGAGAKPQSGGYSSGAPMSYGYGTYTPTNPYGSF